MNFKTWMEMPIKSFNLVGNWDDKHNPSEPKKSKMGYYGDDVGILKNQNAQQKIIKKWGRVEQEFDIYFVRNPKAAKTRDAGEVNPEFLQTIGLNIMPNEDVITLVITNNVGTERMPMNWWTLAHRFGHAIRRTRAWEYFTNEFDREMVRLLKEVYRYKSNSKYDDNRDINDKTLRELAYMIGTMKSARSRNLVNFFEFHFELLAQYMIEGRVKFNPIDKLISGHVWGKPQYRYGDPEQKASWIEYFEDHITDNVNYNLDMVLSQCVNKIFLI